MTGLHTGIPRSLFEVARSVCKVTYESRESPTLRHHNRGELTTPPDFLVP